MGRSLAVDGTNPGGVTIATATLCSELGRDQFKRRTGLMQKIVETVKDEVDVTLLPAGFYSSRLPAEFLCARASTTIKRVLKGTNLTVCLGMNGRSAKISWQQPSQIQG